MRADGTQGEPAAERIVVDAGHGEATGRQRGQARLEQQRQRTGAAHERGREGDGRDEAFHAARRAASVRRLSRAASTF